MKRNYFMFIFYVHLKTYLTNHLLNTGKFISFNLFYSIKSYGQLNTVNNNGVQSGKYMANKH